MHALLLLQIRAGSASCPTFHCSRQCQSDGVMGLMQPAAREAGRPHRSIRWDMPRVSMPLTLFVLCPFEGLEGREPLPTALTSMAPLRAMTSAR